jgi:hypothetical protein
MDKFEYWGGGRKDVVKVTAVHESCYCKQVPQWLQQPTYARGLLKIRGERKASEKHFFVDKTKQATVTSAEVQTDDLWCIKCVKLTYSKKVRLYGLISRTT